MKLENDGERFIPDVCLPYEIKVNVQRYLYAMDFCRDKVVVDYACGVGLGSYFYSLVAKKVIAVDRKQEALDYAKRFNFNNKIEYVKLDLEKDELPDGDIAVALEIIEHLNDPDRFLERIKQKEMVWSIPRNSLEISSWHVQDYRTIKDVTDQIQKLWTTEDTFIQENRWIYGYSLKK